MDRGLYIAATGMLAEAVRQDQLANDLANASTPGYKPDRSIQQTFGDTLLVNGSTGRPIGPVGTGSHIVETATDFTPGPVSDTGEPLDFAVTGEGFFAVATPNGVRYTRNGQFQLDSQGRLVTSFGDRVLSQSGAEIRADAQGHVPASAVGVFALSNPQKVGEGLIAGTASGRAGGSVRQGALEGSNTDPAHTMVAMIASLRAFEAGQRAITTIDETLNKAANQVGTI